MDSKLVTATVSILAAIIGVSIIGVVLSKQSNTVGVIQAGTQGFSSILKAALSPLGSSNGAITLPQLNGFSGFPGSFVSPTGASTGGLQMVAY